MKKNLTIYESVSFVGAMKVADYLKSKYAHYIIGLGHITNNLPLVLCAIKIVFNNY